MKAIITTIATVCLSLLFLVCPVSAKCPDGSVPVLMTGIDGIGRKSVLPGKLPELQLLAGERQGCRHPDDKKANQLSHNVSAILPEDRKM